MQSSLFEPGRPVIFTRSTGERVDATMKGPLEREELSLTHDLLCVLWMDTSWNFGHELKKKEQFAVLVHSQEFEVARAQTSP